MKVTQKALVTSTGATKMNVQGIQKGGSEWVEQRMETFQQLVWSGLDSTGTRKFDLNHEDYFILHHYGLSLNQKKYILLFSALNNQNEIDS